MALMDALVGVVNDIKLMLTAAEVSMTQPVIERKAVGLDVALLNRPR